MTAREVVALNETTPQLEVPQTGDTYTMPRNVSITGNLVISGTVNGRDVAADGATADAAVAKALFDANTILAADSDDTPAALVIAEQTLVGRITAGNIVGLTATQIRTLLNIADGATDDTTADAALPKAGGEMAGNITMAGAETVDGRDLSADGTKLDGIPVGATDKPIESLIVASGDETTDLTTGTAKPSYRIPYAFTVTEVRASVAGAPTGSTIIVDINEDGATILTTKLTIDASEKTSETAATPPAIGGAGPALADDAEITIDIDQIGSSAAGKGLKVTLIGTRT